MVGLTTRTAHRDGADTVGRKHIGRRRDVNHDIGDIPDKIKHVVETKVSSVTLVGISTAGNLSGHYLPNDGIDPDTLHLASPVNLVTEKHVIGIDNHIATVPNANVI